MNSVGTDEADIEIILVYPLGGLDTGNGHGAWSDMSARNDGIYAQGNQLVNVRDSHSTDGYVLGSDVAQHFVGCTAGINVYQLVVFDQRGGITAYQLLGMGIGL